MLEVLKYWCAKQRTARKLLRAPSSEEHFMTSISLYQLKTVINTASWREYWVAVSESSETFGQTLQFNIWYVKNNKVTVIWEDVDGSFLKIWIKITIMLFKTWHNFFNNLYNMIFYKVLFSSTFWFWYIGSPSSLFDSISSVTSWTVGSWKI